MIACYSREWRACVGRIGQRFGVGATPLAALLCAALRRRPVRGMA